MPKSVHEIRDPIHIFVRLDSDERQVSDSRPFQRLRPIHQLGMPRRLYPAATHRRFEHSLGVMELASRVFDVVSRSEKITDEIRNQQPELDNDHKKRYWRRVLRMALSATILDTYPFPMRRKRNDCPEAGNMKG